MMFFIEVEGERRAQGQRFRIWYLGFRVMVSACMIGSLGFGIWGCRFGTGCSE